MSVLGKKWRILNEDQNLPVFERILKNRALNPIEELQDFHDPFLFRDMEKSVQRINEAIKNKERILIFGDYDVDGITATAILYHTLKLLSAEASCRIPNRDDGYGLSDKFVKEAAEKNVKLLITVDNGISCRAPIALAKDMGIDVIVTDHHQVPEQIPEAAYAIIHPHLDQDYPYGELVGAGVALKLAHALIPDNKAFLEQLLDLTAMGTVADLGPLTGENRLIVKRGLKRIQQSAWPGIEQLKKSTGAKDEICSTQIGFRLAPRINAAGRIGDPYIPLKLLLHQDELQLQKLAQELEDLNQTRRDMTEDILQEVESRIDANKLPKILIFHSPHWHIGVLGLVAGKLSEKYSRPSILLQEREEDFVASARSPEFFNVINALTKHKHLLNKFGGHAQAAGFNISPKNIAQFKKAMTETAESELANHELKAELPIDCEIQSSEICRLTLEDCQKLAPFGIGNSKPIFLLRNARVHFPEAIGAQQRHLRFSIETPQETVKTIAFNFGPHAEKLKQNPQLDIVFHLENNRWNNRDYLQLQVIDFKIRTN